MAKKFNDDSFDSINVGVARDALDDLLVNNVVNGQDEMNDEEDLLNEETVQQIVDSYGFGSVDAQSLSQVSSQLAMLSSAHIVAKNDNLINAMGASASAISLANPITMLNPIQNTPFPAVSEYLL